MFSSCFSLLSHLNSTLQTHSQQHFSSDFSPATKPGAVMKGRGFPALCTGWSPHCLRVHLSLPTSMAAQQLSFGQCCAFSPASMTIPCLMSNSQCSCPALLLPPLTPVCLLAPYRGPCLWISALHCFLHSKVPSIFAAFVLPLLLLHVVLCCPLFSQHCSLSCAKWLLFPLWEMSLKNTLLTSKSEIKMSWLGWENLEKYPSSSDESGLSWALIFWNSWRCSAAVMLAF